MIKNLFFIFILGIVTFSINLKAQTIEWQKTYGGELGDYGVKIIQTPDSGYIFLGRTFSYAVGNDDYYLIKLDKLGDTIWTKIYGGTEGVAPHDIINCTDGGYYFCGSNSNNLNDASSWVVKSDMGGNMVWENGFGYRGCSNKILETHDGGCISVGYNKDLSNNNKGVITRFDSLGDSTWSIEFSKNLEEILMLNDSTFFAFGYEFNNSTLNEEMHLIHFTDNGSILNSEIHVISGRMFQAVQIDDTLMVAIGWNHGYGRMWYLNTDLQIIDSMVIGDTTEYLTVISNTSDGGFITCGTVGNSTPIPDYYTNIRKYDSLLQEEWKIVIDSNYEDLSASSIEQTIEGDFIFAGSADNQSTPIDMYAMKIRMNPTTIYVPSQYTTIQGAIDASIDGDTITIENGTYWGEGNRDVEISGKSVLISSEFGAGLCIIDCASSQFDQHRAFYITGIESRNTVINGLTIKRGFAPSYPDDWYQGGAIFCEYSNPTIRNCVFEDNQSSYGGAIAISYVDSMFIDSCIFVNNTSAWGGGVEVWEASVHITNSLFNGNQCFPDIIGQVPIGGAVCFGGNEGYLLNSQLIIDNCYFNNNYCADNTDFGFGTVGVTQILQEDSHYISITNSSFVGNEAKYGGAFFLDGLGNDSVVFENCMFLNNHAKIGSSIISRRSSLSIANSTFKNNLSDTLAILIGGEDINILNSIITQNYSEVGSVIGCFSIIPPIDLLNINKGRLPIDQNTSRNTQKASNEFMVNISCSNIYDNEGGDWVECIEDMLGVDGNLSLDPLFCLDSTEPFLASNSPCLPDNNLCNIQIGALGLGCSCCNGIRGNVNGDEFESIDISDLVFLVDYSFASGTEPSCFEEADIDASGTIDIADIVYFVDFMFGGGDSPDVCP